MDCTSINTHAKDLTRSGKKRQVMTLINPVLWFSHVRQILAEDTCQYAKICGEARVNVNAVTAGSKSLHMALHMQGVSSALAPTCM